MSRRLPGEPMSRTRDDVKQLRQRVNKVNHLRNKEQQHCLAEVSQDADHSKCHPGEVAESVPHKHRGGVPATEQVVSLTEYRPLSNTYITHMHHPAEHPFNLPVVVKKRQCCEEEWYHEVEGEYMVVTVIS